jgi:hypothetical protein
MTHRKLAALVLCAALPAVSRADDPPALRKGMWEYNRTLFGQGADGKDVHLTSKQCVDPLASISAMKAAAAKQGCKSEPVAVKGNVRVSVTECPMKGAMLRSESVMTITNDSAYAVDITTTSGGKTSKEVFVGKRIGDC